MKVKNEPRTRNPFCQKLNNGQLCRGARYHRQSLMRVLYLTILKVANIYGMYVHTEKWRRKIGILLTSPFSSSSSTTGIELTKGGKYAIAMMRPPKSHLFLGIACLQKWIKDCGLFTTGIFSQATFLHILCPNPRKISNAKFEMTLWFVKFLKMISYAYHRDVEA